MIRRLLLVLLLAAGATLLLAAGVGVTVVGRHLAETPLPMTSAEPSISAKAAVGNRVGINETGYTGPFAVTLTAIGKAPTFTPPDTPGAPAVAAGEYLEVWLTVANTSDTDRSLRLEHQQLVAGRDTFYPIFWDHMSPTVAIPAGGSVQVFLVFDAPKDIEVQRVVFNSSLISEPVDIDVDGIPVPYV